MNSIYLTHANILLPDGELQDSALLVESGIITAIAPDSGGRAAEINLKGKTLMPGAIDLHCDALEKEAEPRPNVHFPLDFACAQVDKRNAAAGVTTVFHALSFANHELGVRNNHFAAQIAQAVHAWAPYALIDNRVHCRYEVTDPSGPEILLALLENKEMHMLSVMDHTPGQGQYQEITAYRQYLALTYNKSEAELDVIIKNKRVQANGALNRIQQLVAHTRKKGIPVASHDDDSAEKVALMHELGVGLSEFPLNLEAAKTAQKLRMATIFGAPNILRGKSQSGAMRALDAILHNVADCLCADYHPATLLAAVFRLPEMADMPLYAAARLVTANPARAAGLGDRGEIAVGKRADLVAVGLTKGLPQACKVWRAGKQVFEAAY